MIDASRPCCWELYCFDDDLPGPASVVAAALPSQPGPPLPPLPPRLLLSPETPFAPSFPGPAAVQPELVCDVSGAAVWVRVGKCRLKGQKTHEQSSRYGSFHGNKPFRMAVHEMRYPPVVLM